MDSSKVYYAREYSYVLYMMTGQFYNYLAAVEVQPQSVATPTHKFTHARYSFDRCCTTSGTNNRAVLRLSGTRDKFYKPGTVPEIPGQLEPMQKTCKCIYMYEKTGYTSTVGTLHTCLLLRIFLYMYTYRVQN